MQSSSHKFGEGSKTKSTLYSCLGGKSSAFVDGEYEIRGVVISENNIHDNGYYGIQQCDALISPRICNNRFVSNGWGALNNNLGAIIRDNVGYYNECWVAALAANGDYIDFPSEFIIAPNIVTMNVLEEDGHVYVVHPNGLPLTTRVRVKLRDITDSVDENVPKHISVYARYEYQGE